MIWLRIGTAIGQIMVYLTSCTLDGTISGMNPKLTVESLAKWIKQDE
jgi:hypothetical protein